jgi:hypothetical protein
MSSNVQIPVISFYVSLILSAAIAILARFSSSLSWFGPLYFTYPMIKILLSLVIIHHLITLTLRHIAGDCIFPSSSHQANCNRAQFTLSKKHTTFFLIAFVLYALATLFTLFGTFYIWTFRICPLTRVSCIRWVWVRVLLLLLDTCLLAKTGMIYVVLRAMTANVGLGGEDEALHNDL